MMTNNSNLFHQSSSAMNKRQSIMNLAAISVFGASGAGDVNPVTEEIDQI